MESLRTLRDLGALCGKPLTAESADDLLGKLARSWATTVFPAEFLASLIDSAGHHPPIR